LQKLLLKKQNIVSADEPFEALWTPFKIRDLTIALKIFFYDFALHKVRRYVYMTGHLDN
jgi:hypothetical protein